MEDFSTAHNELAHAHRSTEDEGKWLKEKVTGLEDK